jgi:hypothetical protein
MDIYQEIYNLKYFEKLRNSNTEDKEKFLCFHEGGNCDSRQCLDEFKKHLQLAEEHNATKPDRRGKLRTFKWAAFIQAWAELQAAYYFKEKLGFNIDYEPKRALNGNGKGDIEIIVSDDTAVFVEVTTPIRQQPDVVRTDIWDDYQKSVIITSLSGKYKELPADGRSTMIIIGRGLAGGLAPIPRVMTASIDEFYGENRDNLSAVGFLDFGLFSQKPLVTKYNLAIYPNPSAAIKLPDIVLREIINPANKYIKMIWFVI